MRGLVIWIASVSEKKKRKSKKDRHLFNNAIIANWILKTEKRRYLNSKESGQLLEMEWKMKLHIDTNGLDKWL